MAEIGINLPLFVAGIDQRNPSSFDEVRLDHLQLLR